MTNTPGNDNGFSVVLAKDVRPASRFRPDVIAMQYRLDMLESTTATGIAEGLRRSRIFDLREEIKTASAERDAPSGVVPAEKGTDVPM
ncbi:MAG: hypothetical protein JWO55_447 [Candidatus Saccharibacteria bacterium]|nr:hypothetical protein [Candidatus Saccharibacteria bacterium]